VDEYEQETKEQKVSDYFSHNINKPINSSSSSSANNSAHIKEPSVLFNEQVKSGSIIVERRRVKSQFWQTLDLKNFPCDVQELTLTVTTPRPPCEIELKHCKDKPSSVNVKAFVDSQEWLLYKLISLVLDAL